MSAEHFLLSALAGMFGALLIHAIMWWVKQFRPASNPIHHSSLWDEVDSSSSQVSNTAFSFPANQCMTASQYRQWQNDNKTWHTPTSLDERFVQKIKRILNQGNAPDVDRILQEIKSDHLAWNYFTNQLWSYNSTVIQLMVQHGACFPVHQPNFDPIVFSVVHHDQINFAALDALLAAGAPLNDVDVMDNNILDKMLDPEPIQRMYHYGSLSWDGVVMELLSRNVTVQDRARQKILQYAQALSESNGERLLSALAARDQRHLREEVIVVENVISAKPSRRM